MLKTKGTQDRPLGFNLGTLPREGRGAAWDWDPLLLTQGVGDACLHIVSADVADPILMLWLGKHHYANVPECVDGDLVVVVAGDDVATSGWGVVLEPREPQRDSPQLSP